MGAIVVGAGPTGMFTAIALARRGRDVVLIDRDPGPPARGTWHRKGVMQFHHAHTFRAPVVEVLRTDMPDVLENLIVAGASIATAPRRQHNGAAVQADDVRPGAAQDRNR